VSAFQGLWRPGFASVLLVYGALIAAAGVAVLVEVNVWPMTPVRAYFVDSAADVLRDGGPPLLAVLPASRPSEPVYAPAAGGDDGGAYLFAPAIGWLLGTSGVNGLHVLYLLLFGAAIAAYPLIFWGLFRSKPAAFMAPVALTAGLLLAVGTTDVYWAPAWAILALGPPLLLVATRRPPRSPLWLGLIALGAGLATSLRAGAGLGVVLGCLLAAWALPLRRLHKAGAAALIVAAYLAVTPGLIRLAEDYRDAHSLQPRVFDSLPSSHLFWHPLYLGLGFLPNRWHIRWDDAIGIERAARIDPSASYPSADYDAIVRRLFFDAVDSAPGEVAGIEARKAVVVAGHMPVLTALAAGGLWLLLVLEPAAALRRRLPMLAAVPVLGAMAGLIGTPDHEYIQGWIGALVLLAILGSAALIAAGRDRFGALRRAVRDHGMVSAATAVVAIAMVAAVTAAPAIRESCRKWQRTDVGIACGGTVYQLPVRL
jgi:hypothetical protein